ncbi:hypothetical protein [Parvularcula oceani]|uniref:hypothetical protein n=1 Tax=Parvularcula oceani TaxID=1247963 RepID=UPI000690226A|nr:hypothetical protein [Parvularcula oceani]
MRPAILLSGPVLAAGAAAALTAAPPHPPAAPLPAAGATAPAGNPFIGRDRFISEGCVICHAVSGVGGTVAPAFDHDTGEPPADAVDFAARMWRGAPQMVELQQALFGYQVDIQADDLRHIAAFARSPEAQATISEDLVPDLLKPMLLHEPLFGPELYDRYQGEEWPYPDEDFDEGFEDRRYE